MRRAVVLLSGGLDSATVLALCVQAGFRPIALSFDYGQRHRYELQCARRLAESANAHEHLEVRIETGLFRASALIDPEIAVPRTALSEEDASHALAGVGATPAEATRAEATRGEIPATYVPGRNILFLAYATAIAESRGVRDIYLGVNALDYSGYPDCRPEFVAAFQRTIDLGTKAGDQGHPLRVRAPLIEATKAEIIRMGLELGVDYGLTSSCYDPDPSGRPCRECDSCRLRARGFREAGHRDPLLDR